VLAGLAQWAGIPADPLPESAQAVLAESMPRLVCLDTLSGDVASDDFEAWQAGVEGLERAWFAPLRRALGGRHLPALRLYSAFGPVFDLRAVDRWRFWRRPQPLAGVCPMNDPSGADRRAGPQGAQRSDGSNKAARSIHRRQPPEGVALPEDVLARVLALREVLDPMQCDYGLAGLAAPHLLSGMERAVDRLERALIENERIVVVGDFDADGATSTAVALRALSAMGARDVHFRVPNRFEYGYGLTPEIVAALSPLAAQVLITVDNGVSSVEGVAAARHAGMSVVVTDHHLPGSVLPEADALVNPNLPDDPFPSKHLAGVGVIFYVMLALRARLRESGWFERRGTPEPNLADLLDLVALGTVADVVPLDHNNRILVEQGLRRIRAGASVPGIAALLQAANRNPERTVATDLGFAAGPRLNAAGRLDDMALGIRCLLADDPAEARVLAAALDELNRDRREIEAQMQAEALAALAEVAGAVLGRSVLASACTSPGGTRGSSAFWPPGSENVSTAR
jgi:hypothetical protein